MKKTSFVILGSILALLLVAGCTQNNPSGLLGLNNSSCTDSDNGKDIYLNGYVNGTCADCAAKGTIGSNSDTCVQQSGNEKALAVESSSQLMEFYCSDDGWQREVVSCTNGCSKGACIQ